MILNETLVINYIPKFDPDRDPRYYRAALKKLPQAIGFKLTDSSSYGAIIWIILNDGKEIQLTKKKMTWRNISHLFHIEQAELRKHELVHYHPSISPKLIISVEEARNRYPEIKS